MPDLHIFGFEDYLNCAFCKREACFRVFSNPHGQKTSTLTPVPEKLTFIMDKRAKKRLETVNQHLQLLRQKLAGAKKQPDEAGEVERLMKEIADLESEAQKLKASASGK